MRELSKNQNNMIVNINQVLLDEKRIFTYFFGGDIIKAIQINNECGFYVETQNGKVFGEFGDYLIINVAGDRYPCNKELFESECQLVDE